eukprot:2846522-Alexandrium_andersonii.AAC.1
MVGLGQMSAPVGVKARCGPRPRSGWQASARMLAPGVSEDMLRLVGTSAVATAEEASRAATARFGD